MKKTRIRERCCRRCYAYFPSDARKCPFCGYKYKSGGRYLLDKIKHALKIDHAFAVQKTKTRGNRQQQTLFTNQDVENLFNGKKFKILMYLVLDDVAFLDETSLIELGETLSSMYEN
jgi:hypothetical protein